MIDNIAFFLKNKRNVLLTALDARVMISGALQIFGASGGVTFLSHPPTSLPDLHGPPGFSSRFKKTHLLSANLYVTLTVNVNRAKVNRARLTKLNNVVSIFKVHIAPLAVKRYCVNNKHCSISVLMIYTSSVSPTRQPQF
jgi:hypothetical protein